MALDIAHPDLDDAAHDPPPLHPKFGWFGLLLLPLALLVYLVAMPFFALFWLIEWLLPLQPNSVETVVDDYPPHVLHPQPEDSPSH
jgi:hypothetical protein